MKFHSVVAGAAALVASLILGSCGGGGAQTDPNRGGDLSVQPGGAPSDPATFFAGTVNRITISGGRAPYSLSSTDQALISVPSVFNGHFLDVVPNNPGTIDAGLPAGSLLYKTINIIARDSQGLQNRAVIRVAQNFLTGYNAFFQPSTCPTGAQACSGGETIVTFDTVTNGVLYGNRPFTVSMVQGSCLFENPLGSATLSRSVNTSTDHEGKLTVALFCPAGVSSEVDILRLTDVGSGVSTVFAFNVTEASASQNLQAVPDTFDFKGVDTASCGTGDAQFFVFGGQPPYFAASSDFNITVTPKSDTQPGVFLVGAHNPTVCVNATIVVTDSRFGRTTVTVKTETGDATPAAPVVPLTATPSTVTLTCGQSATVLVTGGSGGTLAAASTDSNLTTAVGSGTVTITRGGVAPPLAANVTSTVNVTDGSTIVPISVTNPGLCS